MEEYGNIKQEISKGEGYLLEIQKDKLVKLLIYLKYNSYYKKSLNNYSEKDIREFPYEIHQELPITDKNTINDNRELLINNKDFNYQKKSTGGSTGTPFSYIVDLHSISRNLGYSFVFWSLFGYKFNLKHSVIAGGSLAPQGKKLKINIYNFLQNRTFIHGDVINFNAKDLKKWEDNDSEYILAYPSILNILIQNAKSEKVNIFKKSKKFLQLPNY